ncbi:unnamed protein product [Dibothriocephalus latus]|uniref:BTB domain-containing protein n=1 Tax=Dibothriocephalus latus TaxID=60516 RepID=A0A3P7NYB4_DIBLA|nr:unnamed protein product [Dibothriocephalus latus]
MAHQRTQTFEDEPALIRCLPQLNILRAAGKLTDMTIELQNNIRVQAHRIVFASRMPSLCDALCEIPTNGQTLVLQWPTISSEVASPFINYIYTGQLEIQEANAAGLIMLSKQFVMPQIEEWVVRYMAARLDSENISNSWELAQLLKSDMLSNACLQYIKATFEVTVASYVFTQLPPEAVLFLLRSDDLQVASEETVCNAIGRWLTPLGEVDETRLVHAEALMREVRWYQVDVNLRYRLQDDAGSLLNKNMECVSPSDVNGKAIRPTYSAKQALFHPAQIVLAKDYRNNREKWTLGRPHGKPGDVIQVIRVRSDIWVRQVNQLKHMECADVSNANPTFSLELLLDTFSLPKPKQEAAVPVASRPPKAFRRSARKRTRTVPLQVNPQLKSYHSSQGPAAEPQANGVATYARTISDWPDGYRY